MTSVLFNSVWDNVTITLIGVIFSDGFQGDNITARSQRKKPRGVKGIGRIKKCSLKQEVEVTRTKTIDTRIWKGVCY